MQKIEISIIIPAYNEFLSIEKVIQNLHKILELHFTSYEILVIDDGSTDETAEIAKKAGANIIKHPYNKGNGAAVKTGIRSAKGKIIVLMDGDGQHQPDDIPLLAMPLIDDDYDMVVGARIKGCQQIHRECANKVYNKFASLLTGFVVKDLTSGFRAIRREIALKFCYLLPNRFSYPTTLTISMIKAGFNLKYVPIMAGCREGTSKIKILRDGAKFFVIMAKIATLYSPLKIFVPVGLLIFLPGFFYAIFKLIVGSYWTIPIVISISVGALIIMMGFLAEMITSLRYQRIDSISEG